MLRPLVLALILMAPAASAWSSFGGAEPSTPDEDPTLMWHEAPNGARNRIYFNVVTMFGTSGAFGGIANPNTAIAGSRIEVVGAAYHEAILGVWIDCNGDGYVGALETGLREYRAELLLDHSQCPRVTGPAMSWQPGAHNYNGWVTELIPVGNVDAGNSDLRVYKDPHAMVWGDRGRRTDASLSAATEAPCGAHGAPKLVATIDRCAQDASWAELYALIESTWHAIPQPPSPPPKTRADWNFMFITGGRGDFPTSLLWRGRAGGIDSYLGVGNEGSRWAADSFDVKPLPRVVEVRHDLSAQVEEAEWFTFYADVGTASVDRGLRTPGGQLVYGSHACAGATTGIRGGWNCDPTAWYLPGSGDPQEGTYPFARPGARVRLLDVDCYDGALLHGDWGVGAPYYGARSCAAV